MFDEIQRLIVGSRSLLSRNDKTGGAESRIHSFRPGARASVLLMLVVGFCLVSFDQLHAQREQGRRSFGGFGGGDGQAGPLIKPEEMSFDLGMAEIPDRATFERLSYQGPDVARDAYLAGLEFVKFIIVHLGEEDEAVYFMNTNNHRAHPRFMPKVGIGMRDGAIRGAVTYLSRLEAPNGSPGLYIVDFQPNDSYRFEEIQPILAALERKAKVLKGKVAFHPLEGNLRQYASDRKKYTDAGIAVHLDEYLYENIAYLPLNVAESFGRLRQMDVGARPAPRDVVIYPTLPNEMPRVAGVITEVRQTPLSHVNLRAVQDQLPNAYIKDALRQPEIRNLLGKWVHYVVSPQGYTLTEASANEVDAYFSDLRPTKPQAPRQDLSIKDIRSLTEIKFENAAAFGAKAANLAAMHQFDLPDNTVPEGYAVPFHFYREFMEFNGFYENVDRLLTDEATLLDAEQLEARLEKLRQAITKGMVPGWMEEALSALHAKYPEGTSLRCRSSTNNEDLAGFSGAGLYDSFTHHPEEGSLSKSIRQVFASLWNYRAFEERQFYRIDHKATAMGVLIHPNFEEEQVNGVAVTDDVLYGSQGNYYVNSQLGEDLVTNPTAEASPEEILLGWWERDGHKVVRYSEDVDLGQTLVDTKHLKNLRAALTTIHEGFRRLYRHGEQDVFAMEIEFKVTRDDLMVIKQARPWVF